MVYVPVTMGETVATGGGILSWGVLFSSRLDERLYFKYDASPRMSAVSNEAAFCTPPNIDASSFLRFSLYCAILSALLKLSSGFDSVDDCEMSARSDLGL